MECTDTSGKKVLHSGTWSMLFSRFELIRNESPENFIGCEEVSNALGNFNLYNYLNKLKNTDDEALFLFYCDLCVAATESLRYFLLSYVIRVSVLS